MWDDLFDPEESHGFFRADAAALLAQFEAELPRLQRSLEAGVADRSALATIVRVLQSIERSAEMLDYSELGDLAARLERFATVVSDGAVPPTESGIEMFVLGRSFLAEIVDAAVAGAPTSSAALEYVDRLDRLTAIYVETARIREPLPDAPQQLERSDTSGPAPFAATGPTALRTLRLTTERADDIARCIGDVAVQAARLDALGGEAAAAAATLERAAADVQTALSATRLTTVGQGFEWLTAAVAHLADAGGKRVAVDAAGNGAPFDRAILAEAGEALLQLLRYYVADIETPADRERVRKSPTATLGFTAFACGNRVVLELIADGAAKNDTDAHALHLARDAVERLSGTFDLDTLPGRGLYTTMAFPLPPALMRCVVVRTRGEAFAIAADCVLAVQPIAERDASLPLVEPADAFGLERVGESADAFAVNIEVRGAQAALAVERVDGEKRLAVSGLGRLAGPVPAVSGAAVLGDGSIALLLDPLALVTAAKKRRA